MAKKSKKTTSFSTKELKALLQGIDTYHGGTDWCPDKIQWKRIRAFIDSLEDEATEAVYDRRQMLTEPAPSMFAQVQPQQMMPAPVPQQIYQPVEIDPNETPELARIRQQLRANMRIPANAPPAGAPIIPTMLGQHPAQGQVLPPATGPSEFA